MDRIEVDCITGKVTVIPLTPEEIAEIASRPPALVPVPTAISDRQCWHQLALDGLITQAEALAAVRTGALPAAVQSYVDTLANGAKFNATMLLSGAREFERANPMTVALAATVGKDAAWLDGFFRRAALL